YLELQITNRCNLKCRHCYIGDTDFKELSIERIKNILTELEEMQGLRVLLTGGEPLLHSRFTEVNGMLPEFSLRKVFFTSGVLLQKEIIKTLNVDELQISIDGLEDAHDSLRGRGTYKAAIGTIEDCLALNYEVSVSTMVHSKNLQDFDKMEKLFKSMGIKEWSVDIPSVTGRMRGHPEFQAASVDAARCLNYGFGGGIHGSEPGFACGLHLMTVMADGRAAKCTFYSDSTVGSAEEGLRRCWQRIRPIRLSDLKCDCEHIESCRGGCRYRAETLGDSFGRDLYKCASYDIMKS
ncbi:MAG: radical SAM protein, partial [Nitrospirae bacterium]|nr:radical SAM protein [Nitrospirota bacterium]